MRFRFRLLPTLTTLAAITAAVGWQYFDLQGRNDRHLVEHRHYGEALWNAVDGIVVREFRGGQYDPEAVASVLAESLERFRLTYVAIEAEDGTTLGFAGRLPDRADPDHWVERPFRPMQPMGRGPRNWSAGGRKRNTPESPLTLAVMVDPTELTARLEGDRQRMLVTSTALALLIALAAIAIGSRSRRHGLRSELATSRARLEGLETLRRLGAGLVHETKNPLGVVRGFAERIARGHLAAEDLQGTASAIIDETDRTVARLDEFLLLSRPAQLRREPIALPGLFAELVDLLRADFEGAGAELVVRCLDGTIDGDRDQLRRLLMNLLLNASQAVGAGDTVTLFCERDGERIRLGVEDDGPGVPPELEETLFEPYVSGRADGTGLGLAISRRIATDHGFVLRHERRQPHGTRMILEVSA